MKKNSIFFVAAMAILTLAGCASRLPSAPIEINTNVPTAPVTGTTQQPKACSMIYAPVCAVVHIQCMIAPCNPVKQTFSNRCMMENNPLAEFLHTGECLPNDVVTPTTPTATPTPDNTNPAPNNTNTTANANNTSTNATGPTAGLANPASVNCEKNGGTLEILEGTGGQYGMCKFADGKECEEWAFFRGECNDK